MNQIKYIFLASTPMHIKLINILPAFHKESIVVFFNRIGEVELENNKNIININLYNIPKIPIIKQFFTLKKIDVILNGLSLSQRIELYYPNDQGIEFQFAISFFDKIQTEIKKNMYEDGIGSLIDRECFRFSETSLKKHIKLKLFHLLFQSRYANLQGFRGTLADRYWGFSDSSFYQERYQYEKEFIKIDMSMIHEPVNKEHLKEERYILLTSCVIEDKLLSKKEWFAYLQEKAQELSQKTDTLYIKPHPRELQQTITEIREIFGCQFERLYYIEKNIAVEDYMASVANKEMITIFGFLSSSLYYCKLAFPQITIGIFTFPHINDPYLNCYAASYYKLYNQLNNGLKK